MDQNKKNESNEEEVWGKLFIKKENLKKDLPRIVERLSRHLKVDEETEEIIFEKHITKIPEKIKLLLIAIFLQHMRDATKPDSINISEISKRLKIKKTSLSKPLGILIKTGYIKKDSKGNYSVIYYKIDHILEELEDEDRERSS